MCVRIDEGPQERSKVTTGDGLDVLFEYSIFDK